VQQGALTLRREALTGALHPPPAPPAGLGVRLAIVLGGAQQIDAVLRAQGREPVW
jgi:acetylglutamate kinase